MKKVIAKILIIFSITLNFAFIYNYITNFPEKNSLKLLNLNLNSSQKISIEKLNQKYHKDNEKLKQEILYHQKKLIDLINSDVYEEYAINNCIDNVNFIQKKIEKMTVKKLFEIRKILKPDQCNYLITNLRNRMNHDAAPCEKECCNTKIKGVTESDTRKKNQDKYKLNGFL